MPVTAVPPRRTLRPRPTAEKCRCGLSTLWLKVKTDPDFPKPFKFSPRITLFFEDEVDEYLILCAARARSAQAA